MATAAEGRAFVERINSNVVIARATVANGARHIQFGQQMLDFINGVGTEPVNPPNAGVFRVEGRHAVIEKLSIDQFWVGVLTLELRMSELALARVEVARKATIIIGDARQGLPITQEAGHEVEELFAKFQDIRNEIAAVLVEILKRVGEGRACSDMIQRHRNELWDVWGGAPSPDSVL